MTRYLLMQKDGVGNIFKSEGLEVDIRGMYILGWDYLGAVQFCIPLIDFDYLVKYDDPSVRPTYD